MKILQEDGILIKNLYNGPFFCGFNVSINGWMPSFQLMTTWPTTKKYLT